MNAGLDLDSHPSLMQSGSYRNALNGNLISHEGNHYSFESTEGTALNWTMPAHKVGSNKFTPHGWFLLGNRLVVHSTDEKGNIGGDGEIGIVTFDNAGNGTYEAMYYHSDLRYTQKKMIGRRGYALEENDAYHRNYWTDDYNQPRVINLAAPILSTTYASGSLVIGDSYMVLTNSIGDITYNGVVYGPKQTAGNIFTATVAGGLFYTTSGSVKVIKLLNPNILNYTPEKAIGSIDFFMWTSGALECGVKLYAYRLYTLDGYYSSWSFTTNPIHVGPDGPSFGYQNYQGADGATNSNKGIILTISDISLDFDKIQVATIEINGSYNVVSNSEIFWDTFIEGESMEITHRGGENLGALLVDDLILPSAVVTRVKDITTIKQRQIIANLTEREEISVNVTATATPFTYEIPVDDHGLSPLDFEFRTNMCPETGVLSGNILPGGHYVVRADAGESVTYNAAVYTDGQTFVGIFGITTYAVVGAPIVRGCIRIQMHTDSAGQPVYKIIDLKNEFFDYKSMASHMYLRGYWREETYRFGVLFFDLFGNPFFVRWLEDVTIPSQSDGTGTFKLMNQYTTNPLSSLNDQFTLNAVGVQFDGLDITAFRDQISGFQIVRVPRDKQVLGQALLWQMVQRFDEGGTLDPNVVVPLSTYDPQFDYHGNLNLAAFGTGWTDGFRISGFGPELDFNLSAFNIGLQAGDRLKAVADYSPLQQAGSSMVRQGVDQQVYSKYYVHNDYTNASPNDGIGSVITVDVYAVNSLPFGFTVKNHDIVTRDIHPDPAFATPGSLNLKAAGGGKRTVFTLNSAVYPNASNGGAGTGTSFNYSVNRKILANYYRPKSVDSLYGGQTENAKANSLYIPTGHYIKVDDAFLASIVDGSGNYIVNGMQVFGGDCFVNLYDRVNSVYNEDYDSGGSGYSSNGSYSYGVIFPCESDINVGLREDRHFCRNGMHNVTSGIGGVVFKLAGVRRDENFVYNPSYSSDNSIVKYAAYPIDFRGVSRFPYMARYSELKNLGEKIDNMRIFLINNFKNVDALHGEINNVFVGNDRLFYLQNKGVGYFPVEEREATTGALGQSVQLGVGGVMQRTDNIDKFYGSQHTHGLVTTEDGVFWPDIRRKTILGMKYNGSEKDVAVIDGLQTFFQNIFNSGMPDAVNIFNEETPLLGYGVVGVYDPRKKCAYMTFKFSETIVVAGGNLLRTKDFTIGMSSQAGKFVGFFSFTPGLYVEIGSRVYMVKEGRQVIIGGGSYSVYDQVVKNGNIYTCIQNFTASNPVAINQEPDFGSSTYWVLTGSESQVSELYKGDICKFFGAVYPSYIIIPVNAGINGAKTFDCAEVYGNNVPFTDVFCETEDASASDQNISAKNRNYRFFDGSWNFTYPLAGKQRLTNKYMLVKLQVKNFVSDITVSTNLQKRIVYLKSLFRFRK